MRRRKILALMVAVLAATAARPVGEAARAAAEPGTDHAGAGVTHRITLVTGDTVDVTDAGGGYRAVAVRAAPRADGTPVVFETVGGRDDYYVIPSDAEPYLASGALDRSLFDVGALIRDGAADALSVIVDYPGLLDRSVLAGRVAALPGATRVVPVTATSMAGVRVNHEQAAAFWHAIAPHAAAGTRTLAGGIARVTLDRTIRPVLDRSVPMIGAPDAWAAGLDGTGVTVGVVDTGIDLGHPDLAGAVVESANFTEDPDVSDGSGHGTHVASTIAGSGAASGGRRKGVAPGAKLVVAKVFDASESATESQVMAGMEWAATHGARVVNLSLGGAVTDGTDPISTLVDDLTARTGALFVAAAGNLGGDRSVTSPGAASSALTVGAVDKQDSLAGFASRGPRLGDAAVKPEIVAPGVAITAARAAGTTMGSPVDAHYTTASGTSMATPHVAGAVAVMAQRHPDWSASRLKDAMVSTARDDGGKWYEQGAGRVDMSRLTSQPVTATGALDVGRLTVGAEPVSTSVNYTNDGASPVTLRLVLTVRGWDGAAAPAGAVSLKATTVTVPAHGTAGVAVTVDPGAGDSGAYGGLITAASDDGTTSLRTPLSYYLPTPTGPITVAMRDSAGQPVTNRFATVLNESAGNTNDPLGPEPLQMVPLGTTTEVPRGTYSVSGTVREATLTTHRWTALSATEVPVNGGDTVVTLDARNAVPIGVTTPTPTEQRDRTVALRRHLPGFASFVEWQFVIGADSTYQVYATPAAPARRGTVSFQDYWTLSDRQLTTRVRGGAYLNPLYDASTIADALAGTRALPLVFVGSGRPEDFAAAAGVRGGLALVAVADPGAVADPAAATAQAARTAATNAANAGSAGVLVFVDVPGAVQIAGLANTPVVQLALSQAEGTALRDLAGKGAVTIELTGRSAPRFMYNLSYFDTNGIPAKHVRPVDVNTLVPVETSYHADKPDVSFAKQWTAYPPVSGSLAQRRTTWTGPARWTEYLGPVDVRVPWQRRTTQSVAGANGQTVADLTMFGENVFRPGEPRRAAEHWFAAPLRNGALTLRPDHPVLGGATTGPGWVRQCAFCRGGGNLDRFVPALHWMDSGPGHFVTIWQNGQQYFRTTTTHLYQGGVEIAPDRTDPHLTYPVYHLPEAPGRYRLTMVDALPAAQRGGPSLALFRFAPRTETTWEFTSRRPTGSVPGGYGCAAPCAVLPLIQLDLQLDLDLNNEAPAGSSFQFMVNAGHRPGADGAADLVNALVSYSTDEGVTWQQARVTTAATGKFLVTVTNPAAGGYVWLKTRVWDTAGNWVEQTVQRAYGLRA